MAQYNNYLYHMKVARESVAVGIGG